MSRRRFWTTVTLLGVTVVAYESFAASITSIGGQGTGPTGDGGTALAVSDGPDAENTAFAQGGDGVAGDLFYPHIDPGGAGGGAFASATVTGDGDTAIHAVATAIGGAGAPPTHSTGYTSAGGKGGDATASALATGSGSGAVRAEVHVTGGEGGNSGDGLSPGGLPGQATVGVVQGVSLGGGDVTVLATLQGGAGGVAQMASHGADGGAATLQDAVSGSTSGHLSLSEATTGGNGGGGSFAGPGAGGSARSSLTLTTSASQVDVSLAAQGGDGGSGSFVGGDAGAALAAGDVTASQGGVFVRAQATGGSGGLGGGVTGADSNGGRAGDASVDVRATSVGDGHAVVIGSADEPTGDPNQIFDYGATGGSVGVGHGNPTPLAGGRAVSHSVGRAEGDSAVIVRDRAMGGMGYSGYQGNIDGAVSGPGGDAVSHAEGYNAGPSSVLVTATAHGGVGGDSVGNAGKGGAGGTADASAYGESTGGGDVTVFAEQIGGYGGFGPHGDAADSIMSGNVSGSTAGLLDLHQIASGGSTLEGFGGNARSDLAGVNPGGGDLSVESEAIGGYGRGDTNRGGSAVSSASASSATGSDLYASAAATGGPGADGLAYGGAGVDGGEAIVTSVRATGPEALFLGARADAFGGRGGLGIAANGGAGADASLVDVVSTEGSRVQSQLLAERAGGGAGGRALYSGDGGRGGDAVTRLAPAGSLRGDVLVVLESAGGAGGGADLYGGAGGRGGNADAEASVVGDKPRLELHALGGAGGEGGSSSGDGGSATLRASADGSLVSNDPNQFGQVTIDSVDPSDPNQDGARGGDGASGGFAGAGTAGRGGDADSISIGIGHGGIGTVVYDRARGGTGGNYFAVGPSLGRGGAATSSADAESPVSSYATAVSQAYGGAGGIGALGPPGGGGDASAHARALSAGVSTATAEATGGQAYTGGSFGVAQALAEAEGETSHTVARATAGYPGIESLNVVADATNSGSGLAGAWAGVAAHVPDSPLGTSLAAASNPLQTDVDAAFAPGSQVRESLHGDSLVLGNVEMHSSGGGLPASVSLGFETDRVEMGGALDLGLGLSNAELALVGDDPALALDFKVYGPEMQVLFDQNLVGADAIRAFFSDHLLLIPGLQNLTGHVELGILVSLDSAISATFGASILLASVPEPSVLALVLVATLAALLPGWRNWQTRRP